MHGLIFVTWEKFLLEHFGNSVLTTYRASIARTEASIPLASRFYNDSILFTGLMAVYQATGKTPSDLLREFGRYFIFNSLTTRLCNHMFTQAHNASELLMLMRGSPTVILDSFTDGPRETSLLSFEIISQNANELLITYQGQHPLCPLLIGATEGAALRYNEKAQILERSCMQKGAHTCLISTRFSSGRSAQPVNNLLTYRHQGQRQIANIVLQLLPYEDGIDLQELQKRVQALALSRQLSRLSMLMAAINHLRYAGLIKSTANMPGDDLTTRRYWRARI